MRRVQDPPDAPALFRSPCQVNMCSAFILERGEDLEVRALVPLRIVSPLRLPFARASSPLAPCSSKRSSSRPIQPGTGETIVMLRLWHSHDHTYLRLGCFVCVVHID